MLGLLGEDFIVHCFITYPCPSLYLPEFGTSTRRDFFPTQTILPLFPFTHPTLLPSSHPPILPSSHPTLLPSYHPTILPSYHPTILPPYHLPTASALASLSVRFLSIRQGRMWSRSFASIFGTCSKADCHSSSLCLISCQS